MSHTKSRNDKPRRSRRPQPDPYTSKIVKPPTKQELETTLRHAVSHQDKEALELYDEWEF